MAAWYSSEVSRYFGFEEGSVGMNEQLSPERILQTGLAFWNSKTLLSAIELGVFTELADRKSVV